MLQQGSQTNDLTQLKRLVIFAHVVEQGSFVRCANLLTMNRSGVSEQIAQLESYLGVRLLHRTTRKLMLTTEGERVYRYAKSIRDDYQALIDDLHTERIAGRIRLTAVHKFAVQWLNPRLKTFTDQYPEITIDVMTADSPLDLVENNIDLAIRIGQLHDSSMVARPLFKEPLILLATPELIQQYGEPKNIDSLIDYPWILLSELSPDYTITLFRDDEIEHLVPKKYHLCNSPLVGISQIQCGMGVGLVLPSRVAGELRSGELVRLLPDWQSYELTYSIVYSSRKQMPKRVRLLLEFLLIT